MKIFEMLTCQSSVRLARSSVRHANLALASHGALAQREAPVELADKRLAHAVNAVIPRDHCRPQLHHSGVGS